MVQRCLLREQKKTLGKAQELAMRTGVTHMLARSHTHDCHTHQVNILTRTHVCMPANSGTTIHPQQDLAASNRSTLPESTHPSRHYHAHNPLQKSLYKNTAIPTPGNPLMITAELYDIFGEHARVAREEWSRGKAVLCIASTTRTHAPTHTQTHTNISTHTTQGERSGG